MPKYGDPTAPIHNGRPKDPQRELPAEGQSPAAKKRIMTERVKSTSPRAGLQNV